MGFSRLANVFYFQDFGNTLINEQLGVIGGATSAWNVKTNGMSLANAGFNVNTEISFLPTGGNTYGSIAQAGGWPSGMIMNSVSVPQRLVLETYRPISQVLSVALGNAVMRGGLLAQRDENTIYHGSVWAQNVNYHFHGNLFQSPVQIRENINGVSTARTITKRDYVFHVPLCNFSAVFYQNYDSGSFSRAVLNVPNTIYATAADKSYPVLSSAGTNQATTYPVATGIVNSQNSIVSSQSYENSIATSIAADAYFSRFGFVNQAIRGNAMQLSTATPEQWTSDGLYPTLNVPATIAGGIVWTETATTITIDVTPEDLDNGRDGVMIKCDSTKATTINVRQGAAGVKSKMVSVWGISNARTTVNQLSRMANPLVLQVRDARVNAAGIQFKGMFCMGPNTVLNGVGNLEVFGTYMAPVPTGVPAGLRIHAGPGLADANQFMPLMSLSGPSQVAVLTSITDNR